MLDFTLSEEQLAIQRLVREFADKEIRPVASQFERDEEGQLAEEIFRKAARIGMLGLPVPRDYGGSEAFNVECSLALEELAVGCGGIATAIGASWFGQTPIMMAATQEQRQRWFPTFASTEETNLCCMAMTEPQGGSDIENPYMESRTIRTRVRIEGERLIVNGHKLWPSNSDNSYLYTVVATTDPNLGDIGSCIVVVPRNAPGLSFGKPYRKMGMDADRNGDIFFDNVEVPLDHLLGKVRDGARILQRALIYDRTGAGAISVGMARGAYEIALNYAKERVVTARPMIQNPITSAMFGDMATAIDAARLLVLRSAWFNAQRGQANIGWATMAKVYASDVAMKVTTDCVQLMGSYGYSKEVGVEKYIRDAKIIQIYIGANKLTRQVNGETL
ncbi:MAG: acyl-CoA dehydrogenase family protein [Dehalococcoidia bacterium]|nr:acyl-CoA dehydrogenase family protein [Dehalococcoidia bacterium]